MTSDYDFKTEITREQFQKICEDLFDRILAPVKTLLKKNNLKVDDLHYFEIIGGGIRIPKIQQILKDFYGR